jgi:hypothetical protein
MFFYVVQVRGSPIAMSDRPVRAFFQHLVELRRGQLYLAFFANSGGNRAEQRVCKLGEFRQGIVQIEIAAQATYAAGDIEANTPAEMTPPCSASNAATPPIGNP